MRIFLLLVAVFAAIGTSTPPQVHPEIGRAITPAPGTRVPLVRTARLATGPVSDALIAFPERQPDARARAVEIQAALQRRFGQSPRISSSADVTEEDYRRSTVIHLGNILTNPGLLWFYVHGYAFADAAYPGGEGYVIRQVHDPKGYGRNVLILGASTPAGLDRGAARFVREIETLTAPEWARFLIVESRTPPVLGVPPVVSPAEIAGLPARVDQAALRTVAEQAIWDAKFYYLSGKPEYLARFKATVPVHLAHLKAGGNHQSQQIYFWLFKYFQIWDAIEESDYWDDAFRRQMHDLLFWQAELVAKIGHFESSLNDCPKYNHETYPAISLLFASEYFRKYYGLAEATRWRSLADGVFQVQKRYVRGSDEAASYFPHSSMHTLYYSIATGDDEYVTSGRAREFGRLLQMLTDNTGDHPGFGDGATYGRNRAYYYLLPLANVLGDASVLGLSAVVREYVEQPQSIWDEGPRGHYHSLQHYIPPLEPALPAAPPGVEVYPLDKMLYRKACAAYADDSIPMEEPPASPEPYFDKLVFRDGFEPGGQYLLMDGFGRGVHGHYDANAIVRFTDNDRIFLVDDTYFRKTPDYHNMVMVIRNGLGAPSPAAAGVQAVADLPRTAFSKTIARDFNGMNWTRNIFWLRGDSFAVIDELEAQEAGGYTWQTLWRGLGEPSEAPGRVQLTQAGNEALSIAFPSSHRLRVSDDPNPEDRQSWKNYPHAKPIVRRILTHQSMTLEKSALVSSQHVLRTHKADKAPDVSVLTFDPTVLLFREGTDWRLYFSRPEKLPRWITTDARMGMIGPGLISFVQATRLTIDGIEVHRSNTPVDLEVNPRSELAQRLESLLTKTAAQVPTGEQDAPPRAGRPLEQVFNEVQERPVRATVIQDIDGHPGDEVVIGGDRGVRALAAEGSGMTPALRWTFKTDSPVRALAASAGAGGPKIVAGTANGQVIALDGTGRHLWTYRIPTTRGAMYGGSNEIFSVRTRDLAGDGEDEIFVTTATWMTHLLAPDGSLIRAQPVARNTILTSAFGDVDGNGRTDILIGSEVSRVHAFTGDGQILWTFRNRGAINRIVSADLNGDGADEVIVGSSDHKVTALATDRKKARPLPYHTRMANVEAFDTVFELDTGGDVLAVTAASIDGRQEILAGSNSFYLYRVGADGMLRAVLNTGDMVRQIVVFRTAAGETRIATGLADGTVLLLTTDLKVLARGDTGSEVLALRYDAHRQTVISVGASSVAAFALPR